MSTFSRSLSPVLTGSEMREADLRAVTEFDIPGSLLMETAGAGASRLIADRLSETTQIHIVCGKGNNGGDGFVVARYLAQNGHQITLWPGSEGVFSENSGDEARTRHLKIVKRLAGSGNARITLASEAFPVINDATAVIVDALFGTGISRTIEGTAADTIENMNASLGLKIALDIPSGLDSDNGLVYGPVFKADVTITFGAWKTGLFSGDAYSCTGILERIDLGLPESLLLAPQRMVFFPGITQPNPPRKSKHKYDGAVVVVIGGSGGLTGAAIMAARAAWKTGIGAVISICPAGLLSIFEKNLIEAVKKPVGRVESTFFSANHTEEVLDIVQQYNGIVLLGPGLGRHTDTMQFVHDFLKRNTRPVVLDADGLAAIADESLRKTIPDTSQIILTPHPGELKGICGCETGILSERLEAARKLSESFEGCILSKGQPGFIYQREKPTLLAGYNASVFTRAGFGDVLAGKIAGFRALGTSVTESCLYALLDGKYKSDAFKRSSSKDPEPLDIL